MNSFSFYLLVVIAWFILFLIFSFIITGIILPKRKQITFSYRDRYINALGSKIRYRQINKNGKLTYIFLHGFGSNLEIWETLIHNFTSERIISIDLIGFGGSDRTNVEYSLETHRQHLINFMDALEVDETILVGWSMGASLSAWTAAQTPDRIQGIVLFAPSGFPESIRFKWPEKLIYRPGMINRFVRSISENSIFDSLFPSNLGLQALDVIKSYNSIFADALYNIKQPTLIIWSKGDNRVPFSYAREYLDRIEKAKLIERPVDAGHNIAFLSTRETNAQINDFFTRIK